MPLFVTFAGAGSAFHLFRIHLIQHLCCPACILSYINHVLRPFCPVNILSCIPPILHLICPSSSESIISCVYTCIHPVLHTLSDMLLFCWQLVLHTLCPPCIYSVLPPSSLLSCIHPVLPPFVQHPFFPICWYSIWRDSVILSYLGLLFICTISQTPRCQWHRGVKYDAFKFSKDFSSNLKRQFYEIFDTIFSWFRLLKD